MEKEEYINSRLEEIRVDKDEKYYTLIVALLEEIYLLRQRHDDLSIKKVGKHYLDRGIHFLQDMRKQLDELDI